ncbi:MAG: hypothetical protein K0S60_266 [Evtepia sp.]|nr:hypothetical protein [Evtepia sp.]
MVETRPGHHKVFQATGQKYIISISLQKGTRMSLEFTISL